MNADPKRAYETYKNDLDNDIYRFIHFSAAGFPVIQSKAECLLRALRMNILDIEEAESLIWELQVDLMEAHSNFRP